MLRIPARVTLNAAVETRTTELPAGPTSGSIAGGEDSLLQAVLFFVVMLVFLISPTPFHDKSGADVLGTLGDGNIINQLIFPLLAALTVGCVVYTRPGYFRQLAAGAYLLFFGWLMLEILVSGDIGTAARRTLFEFVCVTIAAGSLALPSSQRQLGILFAIVIAVTLIISFGGVLFLHNLSVHLATDAIEPDLAGDWRGPFRHKNEAGHLMALLVFVSIYIARTVNGLLGWTLVIGCGFFLVMTHSKTAMALLPFVLLLAFTFESVRRQWQRALVAFALLVTLNVATVGSSWPGPVRSMVGLVLKDVTFTARTDLWRYSAENILKHPVFGHGTGGFWRTKEMMYKDDVGGAEPEDISNWVTQLGSDSHNTYLETALQLGIPGLILLMLWVGGVPLLAYPLAREDKNGRELATLFVRIWLYVLYMGSLETVMLTRNNPVWILMLMSIFGLQMMANHRTR